MFVMGACTITLFASDFFFLSKIIDPSHEGRVQKEECYTDSIDNFL